ncbi:MAG TPA: xanthine dehydrogenase family protein subunit M [Candidatus Nitrosotalea sp.]|nr:xanthine dehydrogenase family protein subunit M [Candidatus Nitrosotalea sp.]
MIPAAFEYARATSVAEAASLLQQHGEDAKVLAGGQSLIPVMRLRLAQPSALIDINPISELRYVVADGDRLRIGALTRHVEIHSHPLIQQNLPLLAAVALEVGDNQVRNLGTIGGVIAHADSAGDYPTLALMLDAEIVTNKRRHQARDFFQDLFTTPLEADELVCEVSFPISPGAHKYIKFRRRRFDWAIVGVAAQQTAQGWRVGLTNVAPTPMRAFAVENALASGASFAEAAESAADGLNPSSDIRATPDYKRHLARVLTRRALEQAEA